MFTHRTRIGIIAAILAAILLASAVAVFFVLMFGFLVGIAHGAGWSRDPAMQKWFSEAPVAKCCSLADGFEADLFDDTRDGGIWVFITETDADEPVCWESRDYSQDDGAGELVHSCRKPLPDQRRFYVTNDKIRWSPPNPTGHGVLFIGYYNEVLCYFLPSLA
jgi:hypothetical protein